MTSSPKTGDLDLGRKIAARREDLGMSRKDLAQATDLSYPYIAQIETGYRLPSTRHQVPIAKALGMSLDEVFGTEESLPPTRPRRTTGGRRPSIEEVVESAAQEIETLPASVRLDALSRIQLRIMQGVAEQQARSRS
jgi:transcriptional regulator with XRE-family HTH domain